MKKYLFYLDGLGIEIWSKPHETLKAARRQVFTDLTDAQHDSLIIMDDIDEVEV